jgi:hypothetical protein
MKCQPKPSWCQPGKRAAMGPMAVMITVPAQVVCLHGPPNPVWGLTLGVLVCPQPCGRRLLPRLLKSDGPELYRTMICAVSRSRPAGRDTRRGNWRVPARSQNRRDRQRLGCWGGLYLEALSQLAEVRKAEGTKSKHLVARTRRMSWRERRR